MGSSHHGTKDGPLVDILLRSAITDKRRKKKEGKEEQFGASVIKQLETDKHNELTSHNKDHSKSATERIVACKFLIYDCKHDKRKHTNPYKENASLYAVGA